jgi:2-hydroxy-6-oxonona-2,4-dienedioate hydrolase
MTLSVVPTQASGQVTLNVDGLQTTARTWALADRDRPSIVLLPGFVTASTRVVPLADRLAPARRVVAIDYPGVGDSEAPDEALTIQELARHVIRFIDRLDLPAVDLLGSSFGCQVATEIAFIRPGLVNRLVLSSPVQDPSARQLPRLLRRWRKESKTQSRPYKKLMVRDYVGSNPQQDLAVLRYSIRDRIEEKLPFIGHRALVMYGTSDPLITRRWAAKVAELLPRGQLAVLPGAPHGMVFDGALETSRVVQHFLETSHPPNGGRSDHEEP